MGITSKREPSNILYLTVVGGNMVQAKINGEPVSQDTHGAISRTYKNDEGETITKWELQHSNLTGFITSLDFKESPYGEQFSITIQNGNDIAKLTMNTSSKYFSDFGKKLPNIDLEKEIIINTYDFESENDEGVLKRHTGVSITQDNVKIKNAYWDGKKTLKGFPSVSDKDRKSYDSDDWKMFFIKIKKFLKKQIESIEVNDAKIVTSSDSTSDEENNNDDLLF